MTTYSSLATTIFTDIVGPDFTEEVRDVISWRHRWRKISNWSEGLSHVVLGAASILAFSAGFFENNYLSYASASCSTICLSMLRFSVYANNEQIERNATLSRLLSTAGIENIPSENMPSENIPSRNIQTTI